MFFYILLESLERYNLLLIKICEIIRHAFQNYNHADTIASMQCAIYNYRINHAAPLSLHILLFQLLSSTFVISPNESIVLIQCYFGPEKLLSEDELNHIINEKLSFPRRETIQENRPKTFSQLCEIQNVFDKLKKKRFK